MLFNKMANNIKAKIRVFLEEDPLYQESIKKGFSENLQLLDSGALDSLGILNLIIYLETQFQVSISIEELSESNFSSLVHIENFIQNKMSQLHEG